MMIYNVTVASFYIAGVFLQNLRTCLYGNEISLYFQNEKVVDNWMNINEYLNLIDKE
jgi:hypothetical protein